MAEYQAVSHIAICVRDMDKALAFYRDALGMKVISDRMTDPGEGGRFGNYTAPRQRRRHVSLALVEGARPTLTITSPHGDHHEVRKAYRRIAAFFDSLSSTAGQLTCLDRLYRILSEAMKKFLKGRQLRPPPASPAAA